MQVTLHGRSGPRLCALVHKHITCPGWDGTPSGGRAQPSATRGSIVATGRNHRPASRIRGIPEATVSRLPLYLRTLTTLAERSVATVSSEELAAAAGVNSAKLRKDFSYLGSYGTRGVGYDVEYLLYQISRELGLTQDWPVVIVGIGYLGHALANYGGFASRGFRVAGLIDVDPAVIGKVTAGIPVRPIGDLETIIRENEVSIGVITAPANVAQEVSDRLVAAGVTSILNFAPTALSVPDGVDVRKVDLSMELQILAFHEQRKSREPAACGKAARHRARLAAKEAKPAAVTSAGGAAGRARRPGRDGDTPAVMPA